jgi:hypothetical protein
MGVYEVTSPDGQTYEVNAPDGASEAEIMAYAQKNMGQDEPPNPEQEAPIDQEFPDFRGGLLPWSRKDGENYFDADTGVLGMVKRAMTQAPAPGQPMAVDPRSAEGGRRQLEAAALFSPLPAVSRAGVGWAGAPVRQTYRTAKLKPPTAEALAKAKTAGYKEAEDYGVEYSAKSVKALADDIEVMLNTEGRFEVSNPELFGVLKQLQEIPADSVTEPTVQLRALNILRQRLGEIHDPQKPSLGAAANMAQRRVEEFLGKADPAALVAGTPAAEGKAASEALSDAIGNAAAEFRSNRITGMEKTAARRTAAANSGKNTDNAIRQRITSLVESNKGSRGLSKEEVAAIDDIIFGRPTKNAARYIGNKFGGGGGVGSTFLQMLAAGGGAAAGGVEGAIVAGAVPTLLGSMGRATANQMSKRELKQLDNLIRSRSPLHEKAIKEAKPQYAPQTGGKEALVRALMGQRFDPNDREKWY